MKNLANKFCVLIVFVWTCIGFACSQNASMQTSSQIIQTNTSLTSETSLIPSQKQISADWFCDERWKDNNYIVVGTVKEIKSSESLVVQKQTEFNKRLSQYNIKNLVSFHLEKTYKGSEKPSEIEVLNLQTVDLPATDFKVGEKYLLYLEVETINKNHILFYYVHPNSRTKVYAESAETIAFLEKNSKRNMSEEILGDLSKEVVLGGIIGGKAIFLPKPKYPEDAKKDKISGRVEVYVLVDESGQVIKAKAICPIHPSLGKTSEEAALISKFSPILYKGKPIKVKGVIVYNFVPE